MLTSRHVILILTLTLALAGCSGVKVKTDYDSTADFSAYDTYAWASQPSESNTGRTDRRGVPTLQQIQQAVDGHLTAIGMRKVSEDEANLLITNDLGVYEKKQINDPYYAFYAIELYEEGSLTLDFIDAKTGHLIWSGTGRRRLRHTAHKIGPYGMRFAETSERRQWRVQEMVDAILSKYPPGHDAVKD